MASSDIILETRGLTRRFGGLTAVDRVDFKLRSGELRALIGPNGAGKTTFFNLITGLIKPTEGQIYFKDRDITGLSPDRISQMAIARTIQMTSIFPGMTTVENVWVAAQSRTRINPFARAWAARDVRRKVEEVISLLGLERVAKELAVNLSHGDQRLLEIAIGLSTDPELLLLDEPTSGLSAKETQETVEVIKNLDKRLTVIVVEHKMDVVMNVAETITVFDQGQILAEGSPKEVEGNRKVQEVYLGAVRHAQR